MNASGSSGPEEEECCDYMLFAVLCAPFSFNSKPCSLFPLLSFLILLQPLFAVLCAPLSFSSRSSSPYSHSYLHSGHRSPLNPPTHTTSIAQQRIQ